MTAPSVVAAPPFGARSFDLAVALGRLRWSVDVLGGDRIPSEGPGVLVVNRRFGVSEPGVVAVGVRGASGRRVRIAGLPDLLLEAGPLRRLGFVLDHPAELGALLDAAQLVVVPLGRELVHADLAGQLASRYVSPALERGVPVLPVAAIGSELGRHWRLVVGSPVVPPGRRTVGRAVVFADAVRDAVGRLLAPEVGV